MAFGFASWVLFFHLLLVQHVIGDSATEANVLILNKMEDVTKYLHHHDHTHQDHGHGLDHQHSSSSSPSTNHKDPQLMVFFMINDLKVGEVMPIYFPNRHLSPSQILSKAEADNIPFLLKNSQTSFTCSQSHMALHKP